MWMKTFVFALIAYRQTNALPIYAERIPNGLSVPNPGPQGGVWAGVGHENAAGGGPINPFGLDFAAQGHQWTTELCRMDSDGDGRSNGLELGDPDCVWQFQDEDDDEPPQGPAVSHPGIVDEAKTIDSMIDPCDGYVSPADEVALDFVFTTPILMNEERTHYICEQATMDVSQLDAAYHKIKSTVLLDNSQVLHHMFIYACFDGAISMPDGDRVGDGPYACSGLESGCKRVAAWAVGPHETCLPENVGELMDFTGMDSLTFKIEAHYDNPTGLAQQDQSGIRIHVTPSLRPLESANIGLGMTPIDLNFLIPPGEEAYPLTNLCPTALLENLEHPVYVYSFYPHMHLYGHTLVTEHYRCGRKIGEIGRIDSYEFDNQQPYTLPSPIKILPGDALVTTCYYNSMDSNATIYGGEETTDEMCLNGLGVYPDPRTAAKPSLLNVCTTFENGVRRINDNGSGPAAIPFLRVAVGDGDGTVSRVFESDPLNNIGACCSSDDENACETMWLASRGMACGVDADCADDLFCNVGLCEDDEDSTFNSNPGTPQASTDVEPSSMDDGPSEEDAASVEEPDDSSVVPAQEETVSAISDLNVGDDSAAAATPVSLVVAAIVVVIVGVIAAL